MVPVMAGGIVLGGKSYGLFEYLQAWEDSASP